MSQENSSIHDFDYDLICEYYSGMERQGPGSPEVTLKALGFIDQLPEEARTADLGCGTGGQSMILAQHIPGHITGIDLFPVFIDLFNQSARSRGLHHRVKGLVGSMEELPFQEGELDLIWSEGAIYNIGFEPGLNEWRGELKTGGYLAVSEASWFTEERPAEIHDFWKQEYPGIDTVAHKVGQMQKAGYLPLAAFILPEDCWTTHFYKPQAALQDAFLQKYKGNKSAEDLVANQRHEAQLYAKYKGYYGYVFYIGRKYEL